MPKVFITNRSGHDFSAARSYGKFVYLSVGMANPYEVTKIYREFAAILRNSDPEDYILVTGLNIMNMIAAAIMARKHGKINLLQYHAEDKSYKERSLLLDELL